MTYPDEYCAPLHNSNAADCPRKRRSPCNVFGLSERRERERSERCKSQSELSNKKAVVVSKQLFDCCSPQHNAERLEHVDYNTFDSNVSNPSKPSLVEIRFFSFVFCAFPHSCPFLSLSAFVFLCFLNSHFCSFLPFSAVCGVVSLSLPLSKSGGRIEKLGTETRGGEKKNKGNKK